MGFQTHTIVSGLSCWEYRADFTKDKYVWRGFAVCVYLLMYAYIYA